MALARGVGVPRSQIKMERGELSIYVVYSTREGAEGTYVAASENFAGGYPQTTRCSWSLTRLAMLGIARSQSGLVLTRVYTSRYGSMYLDSS